MSHLGSRSMSWHTISNKQTDKHHQTNKRQTNKQSHQPRINQPKKSPKQTPPHTPFIVDTPYIDIKGACTAYYQ